METGDLVEEMLAAPVAVAYLAVAQASGLTPAQAADPVRALALCAEAIQLTDPWDADRERYAERLRQSSAGLRPFAQALAAQEGLQAAWFAPMDPAAQTWIQGRQPGPPCAERFLPPGQADEHSRRWEAYAQKCAGGLYTCQLVNGVHPVLLDGEDGAIGDYHPESRPPMWRMPVRPPVRVYEVRDAWDWHALCVAHPLPARETPGAEEDPDLLAPDWPSVAAAWDAVHLTVGGVLLAGQRTVERDGKRTRHWAWDVEQTLWLRWVFDEPEPLELARTERPDLSLPDWYWERA